ncbi:MULTISPECIES: FAD binding domain-containing protein [unclassified Microbacterium]|uniref:xanthine dehydrogenase small subunit n=1 Tax=unclassified Microbacterium TaxID=2609290 RepID=UPI001AC4F2F8|nr:FAD binding domain-containing protein [Microbacterium sp.]MBN9158914.1 FAD binding domain-containing protein [Microbacterium sp.]MBS1896870.1 FAD binding domain-containing protein [Actinomycetota bacterium]
MTDIAVTVNGQLRPLAGTPAHATALDWLRDTGLSGSKEGCAEGECGACAMLLATPTADGGTAWTPVNACLVPVYALDGQEVVTAEGLGSPDDLHPVQSKLAEAGGSQCGYCTPGFACSMAGEYYRADRHAADAADESCPVHDPEHGPNGFDLHALSGNLCRCTGYRPIRDAAYTLGSPEADDPLQQRLAQPAPQPVATDAEVDGARFVRPATLAEALRILHDEEDALLVAGSTDWGVEVNIRGRRAPLVVAIEQLPELRTLTVGDDVASGADGYVEIGAALPLSDIEKRLDGRVPLLAQLLPQFASRLIRNRGTLGGNLGTGSPIGDTPPALLALRASVVLASVAGEREVDLADYFTGYRQTVKQPDELIKAIRIPLPLATTTAFQKIAKRRFDDISSVAVAFALDIDGGVVTGATIGLGGVAATPLRARATEEALIGRPWDIATVKAASEVLRGEGTPMSDHRASSAYRSHMLGTALLKLYSQTTLASKEVSA